MMRVVLVRPQQPGNVGAVARTMLNFGVEDLALVSPCPVDDVARDRAVHAQRVLDAARVVDGLDEALEGLDLVVAFAGRVSQRDRSHLRSYSSLPDFAPELAALDAAGRRVGLVFGPEDDGLANEDIVRADVVVSIPTSEMYRSMNLSHAVAVALYAVRTATPPPGERTVRPATHHEKELLHARIEAVLEALKYPEHRVRVTGQAFRRVLGRAVLTKWEYHRVMGTFTRAEKFLRRTPPYWADEVAREEDAVQGQAEHDDTTGHDDTTP